MKKNAKTFKTWTNIDVKLMLCGVLPQGRSIHSCRQFCSRHRLKFPGKRLIDEVEALIERIENNHKQKRHRNEKGKQNHHGEHQGCKA